MSSFKYEHLYISSGDVQLFTIILRPNDYESFPVVIVRTPYVDCYENADEADICADCLVEYNEWLKNGYAIVIQHCRGRGKSTGDCIPYINEREDGLCLQSWIRRQPFYNGELYLKGASYLSSVHYVTAPYAADIKGAVFAIKDSERYNLCYRNGFFKKALHGSWYVEMYKAKSHLQKNFTSDSFDILPLTNFCQTVFGEDSPDFDQMLLAPNSTDAFWNTHFGGTDARDCTVHANIPILFATGFYDICTGGMFDMWNKLDEATKAKSAFVVSPYNHGDYCNEKYSIVFKNGKRTEQFGENYEIEWFNHIRDSKQRCPFQKGMVTYYRLFENRWATDDFSTSRHKLEIKLGEKETSYVYDPFDAPRFRGGLSRAFGGAVFQQAPNLRPDIITIYSDPLEKDTFIKGKMAAKLKVKSDCPDTCFYIRVSITKQQGDYGLRDDITSLCHQLGDYSPNDVVNLEFHFDEHAFLIKKGEQLRIDLASADNEHYVRHTNRKGLFSEQTTASTATNTIYLQDSYLILPVEFSE